jgi:hypothetical protein
MTLLSSEIAIAASSEVIWDVLVDFGSYADWNPVEIQARGEAVVGGVLEHTAQLPRRKPMMFRAKIIEATPSRALAWKGRILVPGLFDVSHHFEIDPLAGGHASCLRARESSDQGTRGERGGEPSPHSGWMRTIIGPRAPPNKIPANPHKYIGRPDLNLGTSPTRIMGEIRGRYEKYLQIARYPVWPRSRGTGDSPSPDGTRSTRASPRALP